MQGSLREEKQGSRAMALAKGLGFRVPTKPEQYTWLPVLCASCAMFGGRPALHEFAWPFKLSLTSLHQFMDCGLRPNTVHTQIHKYTYLNLPNAYFGMKEWVIAPRIEDGIGRTERIHSLIPYPPPRVLWQLNSIFPKGPSTQ